MVASAKPPEDADGDVVVLPGKAAHERAQQEQDEGQGKQQVGPAPAEQAAGGELDDGRVHRATR